MRIYISIVGLVSVLTVGCSRQTLIKPNANQVKSIRLGVLTPPGGGEKFDVCQGDFGAVLSILDNPTPDPNPAKWEAVGSMIISKKNGETIEIHLYQTGESKGAYSWQCSKDRRQYYRGASNEKIAAVLGNVSGDNKKTEQDTSTPDGAD